MLVVDKTSHLLNEYDDDDDLMDNRLQGENNWWSHLGTMQTLHVSPAVA